MSKDVQKFKNSPSCKAIPVKLSDFGNLSPKPLNVYFSRAFQLSSIITWIDNWNIIFNITLGFSSRKQLKCKKSLTPQKLNSTSHSSHCSGDEIRHTATHEGSESHQEKKATTEACHDGANPPFCTGDALERGIAPTFFHHYHHLPAFIMYRIWAPPESTEGHRLAQLGSPEPVRHKEPHAGGSSTKKWEQSPDHPSTRQAGCHLSPDRTMRTQSNCFGAARVSEGVKPPDTGTPGNSQFCNRECLQTEWIFSLTGPQLPILCSKGDDPW